MTIEECIKKTFEGLGHTIEGIKKNRDGSFSLNFIGQYGVARRRVRLLFVIEDENPECEYKDFKPNDESNAGRIGGDPT